jgi:hypothetical protein
VVCSAGTPRSDDAIGGGAFVSPHHQRSLPNR